MTLLIVGVVCMAAGFTCAVLLVVASIRFFLDNAQEGPALCEVVSLDSHRERRGFDRRPAA